MMQGIRSACAWAWSRERRTELFLGLALAALTFMTFVPVCWNDFVNYDDDVYVTGNLAVLGGIDLDNVWWAFTTTRSNHWHPLTWISLQFDADLYTGKAWGFHLTNLLLHVANVLLLYRVWWRMTGMAWRSAAVAAFFAVHPLHVESVAWVTERKDVLSTFFWLLTMTAYVHYARHPDRRRYALVVVPFVMGLLSKSMLITLPAVLLLLDYWPLRRIPPGGDKEPRFSPTTVFRLILEKVPLVALAGLMGVVSMLARAKGGGIKSGVYWDLTARLSNAVVSYGSYLRKMAWPNDLAVFYPFPEGGVPVGKLVAVGLALGLATLTVLLLGRKRPYLCVGWLWYLGTLVPVIGFVQLGSYALADRYTYVPSIGIFVLVVWAVADLIPPRKRFPILTPVTVLLLLVCVVLSRVQIGYWRDSVSLWEHALAVTPSNFVAQTNLGMAYLQTDEIDRGVEALAAAVRHRPDLAFAHLNLGQAYLLKNDTERAIASFRAAVDLQPQSARYRHELARALHQHGLHVEAEAETQRARQLK